MVICLAFLLSLSTGSANAQTFEWAQSMGGGITDQSYGVAVEGGGNVYVTGGFNSAANFNPGGSGGTLISAGGQDAFLAKYDASNNFLWAKSMGGSSTDYGRGVAVDGSGNVYVTGEFNGTADFNTGGSGGALTSTGDQDVFLVKYDASGNYIWAKSMGGSGTDYGYGIAVDGSGNVYVTGWFLSDTANFNPGGSGGMLTNTGGQDVFLAKYDSSGSFLWVKSMGGNISDQGSGIAVDGSGNVYVTGFFQSATANFNPGGSGGMLTNAGGQDVFLAKYDSSGSFLWVKSMGGSRNDYGRGVAMDGSDNVYVMGHFQSDTANFNPGGSGGTLTTTGGIDVFLAKYDAGGSFLWAKSMGGRGADYGLGVAVDGSGNGYVTGYFTSDTADFNPGGSGGTLTTAGGYDVFLAKYDAGGSFLWAKSMGGSSTDYGLGVAVDGSGNGYVTGYFISDTADFNPGGSGGTLTTAGGYDVFLAKFGCSDTSLYYFRDSTVCGSSYTWNEITYTTEGTHIQVFPNIAGCDSTVTLDLTFTPIDKPAINIDSFTLGVTGTYVTYQWLLNGEPIPGANNSKYDITENGNYQVVVTDENGCTNTSDIYPVNNYTTIKNVAALPYQIQVYPNPAADIIYIQSPVKVNVRITDMAGKLIKDQVSNVSVSIRELAEGMYLLHITDNNGILLKVEKLLKAE